MSWVVCQEQKELTQTTTESVVVLRTVEALGESVLEEETISIVVVGVIVSPSDVLMLTDVVPDWTRDVGVMLVWTSVLEVVLFGASILEVVLVWTRRVEVVVAPPPLPPPVFPPEPPLPPPKEQSLLFGTQVDPFGQPEVCQRNSFTHETKHTAP